MLVPCLCATTLAVLVAATSNDLSDSAGAAADPAQYVNTFIGTLGGGNTFPGATLPFGSVKAVADAVSSDGQGGFVSDGSPIKGISQLHDDGTGGGASLGNFKILPLYCSITGDDTSCVTNETERALSRGLVSASPGYFSIGLGGNITAEMTVTAHAALHRITYHAVPKPNAPAALLVDLTNDGMHSFSNGSIQGQQLSQSTDRVWPQQSLVRVTGGGNFRPSFGQGNYNVYFCLDAPGIKAFATYEGSNVSPSGTLSPSGGSNAGALLQLDTPTLKSQENIFLARIGVSFLSTDQACHYATTEIPNLSGAGFDSVRTAARAKWNDVLGTVQISTQGVDRDTTVRFWSSLYRTYISPINVTGDNPLWESSEPYYDSFYCIWDTFRVVHPLYTITQPGPQAEMVRALVDIYRHVGWLPDCRMSLDKGYTQGGSNADNVLADTFVKGITGGIDWATAYEAVVKDATVEPPDWGLEGRNGLKSRAQLHYVPKDDTTDPSSGGTPDFSASHTLEYSYNDFSIAQIAKGLGKTDDYNHYLNASGDWANLWDTSVNNTGYSGFIQARYTNGSFAYVDPRHCSPVLGHEECYGGAPDQDFYEASSWEYSFYAPHDMARLIALMGGPQTFIARLDAAWDNTFIDIYDEPAFLPAFLYNYAGAPARTVDRVHGLLATYFNTSTNGLPGNDDSGAMGAFVVWGSVGLFPVAGQAVYLLSTPLFAEVAFRNAVTRTTARITTVHFDGAKRNRYVQSAKLDGKPYTKNWISHDIFTKGGTLELTLGPRPSSWGTNQEDLPPSVSTGM
ncbi:alpha-1,2-mannosidase, putative subfamily [Dentipellis sp. KUC8613]|nr:alpha-1,2-mannosidase, putative subfamily [Dentipellis sp. KUC8613]